MPVQFIQENHDKFAQVGHEKIQQRVILRAHSPCGRSARTLFVQSSVNLRSLLIKEIRIGGNLYFAITNNRPRNRLREGDSLIFYPKEDAKLKFEVHVFCGTQEFSPFPDEGGNASTD